MRWCNRLGLLLAVCAAGCDLPGRPDQADRPVPQDQLMTFVAPAGTPSLFGLHCAACHGADGQWGPAPPLNDPLFRALIPEKELEKVIAEGRPGTPMPGFARTHAGALTGPQIQVLVNEIKGIPYRVERKGEGSAATFEVVRDPQGIAPAWGTPDRPPEGAPPYLAESSGDGSSREEAGKKVFASACAACHGEKGEGVERDKRLVRKLNDPVFLALISDQALRRIAITGRSDFGMPDYSDEDYRAPDFKPLTSQQVSDVVALLASWRQGTIKPK